MKAFTSKTRLETSPPDQRRKGPTAHEAAASRTLGAVDHRPGPTVQRKLRTLMHQSPRVQRQVQLHQAMNDSPRVRAHIQLQTRFDNRPRPVAFGAATHRIATAVPSRETADRSERNAGVTPPVSSAAVVQRHIGYEYQMLNSKVKVRAAEKQEGEEHEIDGWKPIEDSGNLELMTTETLKTKERVEEVVGEMQELGGAVSQASVPSTIASYGGQAIDIVKPDNRAQPQVNFDLALGAMAGSFGAELKELRQNDNYFGANEFGWSAERSETITSLVATMIEKAHTVVSDEVIRKQFPKTGFSEGMSAELLEDIRGYVVADLTQQMQRVLDRQLLTKDVPLLIKTDLPQLRSQLAERIQSETANFDKHETKLLTLAKTVWPQFEPKGFNKGSSTEIKRAVGSSLYQEKVPHSPQTSKDKALGILLELRRANQIPVDQWVTFALDAFRILGLLYEPEEKSDEKKKTDGNESDSDSFFDDGDLYG